MYLGPILNGKCINDFPPKVVFTSTETVIKNETVKGNRRYHHKGFHLQFTLDWSRSKVSEAQWKILKDIINKQTQILLIPYPDKYPNSSFYVASADGIENLSVSNYVGQGYKGSMSFETINPVTEIPDWEV